MRPQPLPSGKNIWSGFWEAMSDRTIYPHNRFRANEACIRCRCSQSIERCSFERPDVVPVTAIGPGHLLAQLSFRSMEPWLRQKLHTHLSPGHLPPPCGVEPPREWLRKTSPSVTARRSTRSLPPCSRPGRSSARKWVASGSTSPLRAPSPMHPLPVTAKPKCGKHSSIGQLPAATLPPNESRPTIALGSSLSTS